MAVDARALYRCLEQDLTGPLTQKCLEVTEAASKSLLTSFLKKFEDDGGREADIAAFDKFLLVNDQCERFKFAPMHEWEWMVIGETKDLLYHFFHPTSVGHILTWESVFQHARPGPGASIGARGEDFYTKHFDSTLTYTHKARFLVTLYQRYLNDTSWWKSGEILRQTIYGFKETQGSVMSTVPKNADISRTTCTEPSLNMFFQLGVGEVISDRLREWGLNIPSQAPINQELARVGSLTGAFGTIDLSSASDSLSIEMMRFMLPQDVFTTLWVLRSDETQVPGRGTVPLHMISTMGNGYTFPLQTVLFTCVVLAVYRCLGIHCQKRCDGQGDSWAVFGDDIIVRREAYNLTVRILELLGFSVNSEKSFNEGPFRESCGTDWYAGTDVRGVYCKTLTTVGSRFSLINRLMRWSTKHGIVLKRTISLLCRTVPRYFVPFLEQDDAGIKVPEIILGLSGRQRFGLAYKKVQIVPPALTLDKDGLTVRSPRYGKSRRRRQNDYAVVVCALQGSFSGGTLALRVNPHRDSYQRCRGRATYWDAVIRQVTFPGHPYVLHLVPVLSPDEWRCWSSTVRITLRT